METTTTMPMTTTLDWTKKVAIVFIIIIISYLLFQYLYNQKHLYNFQSQTLSNIGVLNVGGYKEGMEDNTDKPKDIKFMMMKDTGSDTQTVNPEDYPGMTLKDFVVKSSYNTAYIGSEVSLTAISYALERGYRYLDFEVYHIDGLPCVGYCEKPKATPTILTSTNSLPLGQVLYTIATGAFSPPVKNTEDPLFINLRIYTKDVTFYEMVAKMIDKNIKNRMYNFKVDADTTLEDIMGKIVVFVDVMAAPDYDSLPNCSVLIGDDENNCFNLSRFINTESGGKLLKTVTYDSLMSQTTRPPTIDTVTKATNLNVLTVAYPDVMYNLSNPVLKSFVVEYGIQFTTVRLNIFDTNLKEYETFFTNSKSAIVPISKAFEQFK